MARPQPTEGPSVATAASGRRRHLRAQLGERVQEDLRERGEWLQQATVAIRAQVPLEVMNDVIQPFPTFSEVFLDALTELGSKLPAAA